MTNPPTPPVPPSSPSVPSTPAKKSSLPWILGGCGCLTLLVLCVVIAIVLYRVRRNTSSSSSSQITSIQSVPLPADYPADIPVYPGAVAERVNKVIMATAPTDYSITLVTKANFKDVVAYYDKELPANGWMIAKRSDKSDAAARQGFKKPAKVAITITGDGNGTVSIVIGNTTKSPNW
jgi:hypothetical protein